MKVSIVGVGRVGATTSLLLATRHAADEIVLVGRDPVRTEAEAADLRHAAVLGRPIDVRAGRAADTAGSAVVVLTVGVAHPGEADRGAAARENAALLRELVPPLAAASPDAVLVVVTNPVDAMTEVVLRASGFPPARVLGLGTLLDTMRLRDALSRRLGMQARDVHAYVVGEHGTSQFVAWSSAGAGGGPLALEPDERREVETAVRDAGAAVFLGKGDTSSGTAVAVVLLVESILRDAREVLPVSALLAVDGVGDVALSLPAVIGAGGLLRRVEVVLSEGERAAFARSARAVRAAADGTGG